VDIGSYCLEDKMCFSKKKVEPIKVSLDSNTLEVEWNRYPPESGIERISPQGWIDRSKVEFYKDKMVIRGKDLSYGILADTNSMDGVMDYPHTTINEKDFDRDSLKVGDIVSYNAGVGLIIHQIIRIEEDAQGRLYTLQGINNHIPDGYLVRNSNIVSVMVGLIYTK